MPNLKFSIPSKIVLIGASTGGPGQIEKIIKELSLLHNTTVIIAQHMSMEFMPSFIKRLQNLSINPISIVVDKEVVKNSNIYFCSGITSVSKNLNQYIFNTATSDEHKYNPDINSIFTSLVDFTNELEIFCVILTGIGDDGVEGCRQLSIKGAKTATQNEASAIVDGMPSRARKYVPNIEVLSIEEIKYKIKEFCS